MDDPRFAAAKRFAEEDVADDAADEHDLEGDEGGGAGSSDGESGDGESGDEEEGEGRQGAAGGDVQLAKKKNNLAELSQKKLERIKANIEKTGATAEPPVGPLWGTTSRSAVLDGRSVLKQCVRSCGERSCRRVALSRSLRRKLDLISVPPTRRHRYRLHEPDPAVHEASEGQADPRSLRGDWPHLPRSRRHAFGRADAVFPIWFLS